MTEMFIFIRPVEKEHNFSRRANFDFFMMQVLIIEMSNFDC